jgi:hypothetical protein
LSDTIAAFVRYVISPCLAESWEWPCQSMSSVDIDGDGEVRSGISTTKCAGQNPPCVYGKAPVLSCFNPKLRSEVSSLLHSAPRPSENGSEYQKPLVDTSVISGPSHQWGTFPTTQDAGRPCQVGREVPSTANKGQDILS